MTRPHLQDTLSDNLTMSDTPFWVGTSWKMNKTLAQAIAFAEGLLASP